MTRWALAMTFVISNLFIVACDRNDKDSPGTQAKKAVKKVGNKLQRGAEHLENEVEKVEQKNALSRQWATNCQPPSAFFGVITDLVSRGINSERVSLEFTGEEFSHVSHYYEDGNCQNEAMKVQYSGRYELKDVANVDPASASGINVRYEKVSVDTVNNTGRDLLNVAVFCGKSDWSAGQSIDLTSESDQALCPLSNVPFEKYDLYLVEDDRLYFGTTLSSDGPNTDSARPTRINREVVLVPAD